MSCVHNNCNACVNTTGNRIRKKNFTIVLNKCSSSTTLCDLVSCNNANFLGSVQHLPENVFIIACNNTINVFSVVEKSVESAYKRATHVVNAFMQNCANKNNLTIKLQIVYTKYPSTNEDAIISRKFVVSEKGQYLNNYYLNFKVPDNGTIICY